MTQQPEVLRLADELEGRFPISGKEAAVELRRQHAEIERLGNLCYYYIGQLTALRAAKQMQQRIDELKSRDQS